MISKVKYSLSQIRHMIKMGKRELLGKFLGYMMLRYIFHIKKDVTIHNFYGQDIVISNDGGSFNMLMEIWLDNIYIYLGGCDHFLDVGGFLGESAIYFATINNKVTVYEADPDNYSYLRKNVGYNNKITPHYAAVVGSNISEITFYKTNTNDPGASIIQSAGSRSFVVQCVNFFSILDNYPDIDGLKLDIEGGEYDIIQQFNKDNFVFKKGQIEFHDLTSAKLGSIICFIKLLQGLGYMLDFIDISGTFISFENIKNFNHTIFTMYFAKL